MGTRPLERDAAMVHIGLDWMALLIMAASIWMYSRWLLAMETDRAFGAEMIGMMQAIYGQMAWQENRRHCTWEDSERHATAVDRLQCLLEKEVKAYREAQARLWRVLLLTAICFLLGAGLLYALGSSGVPIMFVWLALPLIGERCLTLYSAGKRVQNILRLLQKYQVQEGVGAMLDALRIGNSETSALATRLLIMALPSLKPADAAWLENRHHVSLHRALHSSNQYLVVAALKALEQVGDCRAIGPVRRLTTCPVWIANGKQIEQAAQQCLLQLQQRNVQRQTRKSLLRAATISDVSSAHLLRPAQEIAWQAEQLLRAEGAAIDSRKETIQ